MLLRKYGPKRKKLNNAHNEEQDKMGKIVELVKLIRNAAKLAMAVSGDNGTTEFNKRAVKFASPRLLSLAPEESRDEVSC
ncbi:unnamed protein product [Gongylonema pulchrum]|uniref:Ras-associating domain-containing protein n=1 Tax=Gongylonema pulchrum TaxID=637853 RepID=A0A183DGU2_9BILA|nr:unnamed protein product [Gongylonema pulchrum]